MEKKLIKILVLTNRQILISQIEEIGADIGEPDCKLIKPFIIKEGSIEGTQKVLEPFLLGYTKQDTL
jgi:hypothetical protein